MKKRIAIVILAITLLSTTACEFKLPRGDKGSYVAKKPQYDNTIDEDKLSETELDLTGLTDEQLRAALIDYADTLPYGNFTYDKGLYLAEGVNRDMLYPSYWSNKISDAGRILLSEDEIMALNDKFMREMYESVDNYTGLFNLDRVFVEYTQEEDAKFLDTLEGPTRKYYLGTQELGADYWNNIVTNLNKNSAPDGACEYAICINRTDFRIYPTADNLGYSPTDTDDELEISGCLVNDPLIISHKSLDGQWYYVYSEYAKGWMAAKDVAIVPTKEQWKAAMPSGDFLVVTGDYITLDADAVDAELSHMPFYMGTKLQIINAEDITIRERSVANCYVVNVPRRDESGYLYYKQALVPISRDISYRYLDYTTENVLKQAFKCLGDTYGWGGSLDSRDCSEYAMEVYRCFGFRLPRNSTYQNKMPCNTVEWTTKTPKSTKYINLNNIRPGSILFFKGHIMLYIGEENGKYYVISAMGRYYTKPDPTNPAEADHINDKNLLEMPVLSVNINSLDLQRSDGSTWVEKLLSAKLLY